MSRNERLFLSVISVISVISVLSAVHFFMPVTLSATRGCHLGESSVIEQRGREEAAGLRSLGKPQSPRSETVPTRRSNPVSKWHVRSCRWTGRSGVTFRPIERGFASRGKVLRRSAGPARESAVRFRNHRTDYCISRAAQIRELDEPGVLSGPHHTVRRPLLRAYPHRSS